MLPREFSCTAHLWPVQMKIEESTGSSYWAIPIQRLHRITQVYMATSPIFIMSHNRFRDCGTQFLFSLLSVSLEWDTQVQAVKDSNTVNSFIFYKLICQALQRVLTGWFSWEREQKLLATLIRGQTDLPQPQLLSGNIFVPGAVQITEQEKSQGKTWWSSFNTAFVRPFENTIFMDVHVYIHMRAYI